MESQESQFVQVLANVISTLTVLSCLFLKVPQIMHMKEKRSSEGIYLQAMLLEITGFSIVTLYNFTNQYSVMTYLEYPIILMQIYVMLYYVLKFRRIMSTPLVHFSIMFYIGIIVGFASEILPKGILSYLLPFCTPLSGTAKVTYIYGIIKTGNADAVSLTTWVISVLTNLSRLFTVYVDSADMKLMLNFLISSMLSAGVLVTAMYHQIFRDQIRAQRQRRRVSTADKRHKD